MMRYYWELEGKPETGWFLDDKVYGVSGCFQWLLEVIPDNESVLDIGCGPGTMYEVFKRAKRNNDYLGIDVDSQYLKLAEKLFPGISTRQTDAFFLPWGDDTFDNTVLFTVLDCVPDFRKPVDEAFRTAKKQVIITIWVPLIEERDYNAMAVAFPPEYVVRINKDKFNNYLKSFGKKITNGTIKVDNKPWYYWWIIDKAQDA